MLFWRFCKDKICL